MIPAPEEEELLPWALLQHGPKGAGPDRDRRAAVVPETMRAQLGTPGNTQLGEHRPSLTHFSETGVQQQGNTSSSSRTSWSSRRSISTERRSSGCSRGGSSEHGPHPTALLCCVGARGRRWSSSAGGQAVQGVLLEPSNAQKSLHPPHTPMWASHPAALQPLAQDLRAKVPRATHGCSLFQH